MTYVAKKGIKVSANEIDNYLDKELLKWLDLDDKEVMEQFNKSPYMSKEEFMIEYKKLCKLISGSEMQKK